MQRTFSIRGYSSVLLFVDFFALLVTFFEKTMSWLSNYLFGQYSDESVVPDSYEETAISDSFEKPVSSNLRETEVVSGIRYRDNTVQLDLNTPVEDPYTQQRISVTVATIALYSRSVIQRQLRLSTELTRLFEFRLRWRAKLCTAGVLSKPELRL
ncbi:hypothetical protein Hdeb2414_s0001g00018961 [Helianthus debilis subsp. tardiflorus]